MTDTLPNADAQAALDAHLRRPVAYVFLDLLNAPLRVTNAPYSVVMSGTGDEDMDGTYLALDPRFVAVGPIKQKEGGGDTVTLQLSGLPSIDDAQMTELGNKALYQGRDVRIWRQMRDPDTLLPIGNIWHLFGGIMNVPKIIGDRNSQVIQLQVESYLAFYGRASGRTYLNQSDFDPADHSADLSIGYANGMAAGGAPVPAGYSTADLRGGEIYQPY